jgi:hypothetical protein
MVECIDVCCRRTNWSTTLEVGFNQDALEQVTSP